MDEDRVRRYLLKLVTVLGQMNHISGKNECSSSHKDDTKKHAVLYHENGRMSMPVKDRADLIDEGFRLLKNHPDVIGPYEIGPDDDTIPITELTKEMLMAAGYNEVDAELFLSGRHKCCIGHDHE